MELSKKAVLKAAQKRGVKNSYPESGRADTVRACYRLWKSIMAELKSAGTLDLIDLGILKHFKLNDEDPFNRDLKAKINGLMLVLGSGSRSEKLNFRDLPATQKRQLAHHLGKISTLFARQLRALKLTAPGAGKATAKSLGVKRTSVDPNIAKAKIWWDRFLENFRETRSLNKRHLEQVMKANRRTDGTIANSVRRLLHMLRSEGGGVTDSVNYTEIPKHNQRIIATLIGLTNRQFVNLMRVDPVDDVMPRN